MDSSEDLSARLLFKHILNIEPPRTPLTRSTAAKITSGPRRSSRLRKNDAGAQTPQGILRRSLKSKLRESISNKTLSSRRTASTVLKNTPAPDSVLFDYGDTPRHILKNILLTEPVKSPVVNEQAEPEAQQDKLSSPNSSLQSRRPSIELSGLELPDLTIGNFESTVKGLSRKRPHRSLNVTAFEKRLKEGNVEEDQHDQSSLSLSSSTSLSLKTPFIDVRTEKKGLQRRRSNRRKITDEEFGAAVDKRHLGNYGSLAPEQGLSETTYSDGFTLGLSKLSEPDITTDIVHCNTALYAQTDGIMSNNSTLGTQDKPTVMASQIQRDLEGHLEAKEQPYSFPMEENTFMDVYDNNAPASSNALDEDAATTNKSNQDKSVANFTFDIENKEHSQSEEADDAAGRVCAEDQGTDIYTENEDRTDSQSSDDVTAESAKEQSPVGQQSHQEGSDPQINDEQEAEGDGVEGIEDDVDQDENELEGDEDDEQANKDEVEGNNVESDGDDVEGIGENVEYISRRAPCTEGGLVMPIQKTGGNLADNTKLVESPTQDKSDVEADPDTDKENSFYENDILQDDVPPEHVEREEQSGNESEEEVEEENEDIPSKTPAFIKQKIYLFNSLSQASPFAPKNCQPSDVRSGAPAAHPKPKAQRKRRTPEKDPGLPKSYLMNVFKHFAKTKVSADVYPVLKDIMDKFFDRLAKDLEAYALHARRSTIEVSDCELLLRRQGHVSDKVPVEVLIEKYLRLDQRKLLIPIATSGNVFPKKR